jgi:hypothetical protein
MRVGFSRSQNLCRAFVPSADLWRQLNLVVGLGARYIYPHAATCDYSIIWVILCVSSV